MYSIADRVLKIQPVVYLEFSCSESSGLGHPSSPPLPVTLILKGGSLQ